MNNFSPKLNRWSPVLEILAFKMSRRMQISFFTLKVLKNETLNKQVTKKANVVLDVIVCMKNRLKFLTCPHKVYLPYVLALPGITTL